MRNLVILGILFLILSGGCASDLPPSQQDQKSVELIKQVNDILDKMETPEFWEQKAFGCDKLRFGISPLIVVEYKYGKKTEPSVQAEINFLVKNKDVALPLIFKRLDSNGVNVSDWAGKSIKDFFTPRTPCGLKTRQLLMFFDVFWETKSIESIPYICEFLRSIPEKTGSGLASSGLASIGYAREAISAITEGKVDIHRPLGKIKEEDKRAAIATLAQEWYDEYKKSKK